MNITYQLIQFIDELKLKRLLILLAALGQPLTRFHPEVSPLLLHNGNP